MKCSGCHILDDVVDAFVQATGQTSLYGGAYNLGHSDKHSLLEFVGVLSELADFPFELIPFPEDHKVIDIGDYYADFDLFKSLTEWSPKINLNDGLSKTLEYFREHGHKYID